jgi:hypothetical protein
MDKRADEKARTEQYGFPYAKTPVEQAEMAQAGYNRAAPGIGPETADAAARKDIAQTTAEGVLREGSQGGAMDLGGLAQGFDPSNAESVRQMQRMLNQAGFTGADGQPLAEDGRFGPQSEAALRKMQGGHREDFASIDDLKGGRGDLIEKGLDQRVNTRGKEELYSRDGRGQSTVAQPVETGWAGGTGMIHRPADIDLNSRAREEAVGGVRSGAKGIDDAIEAKMPWLSGTGAYRGAKGLIKKGFGWAGDADY